MSERRIRSVLVATDLAEGSSEVVESAVTLAVATGAELHVVHVVEAEPPPVGGDEQIAWEMAARKEEAERELAAQAERLVPADVRVDRRLAVGSAHRTIVDIAEEVAADVIVLGPQRGGAATRLLGSTADRVLRTAEVPCLIVRAPLTVPLERIGVAVDFSVPSRGALGVAIDWASHAIQPIGLPGGEAADLVVIHASTTPGSEDELLRAALEEEVDQALVREGVEGAGPPIRIEVVRDGKPAVAIADRAASEGLDLLVLGTHGRAGLKRVLVGSTAAGVAREAVCPVLFVPPGLARRLAMGPQAWESRTRMRRVVVAMEFTEASLNAARWTVENFARGADFHFVHALDLEDPPDYLGGPTAAFLENAAAVRAEAEKRLRTLAYELVGGEPISVRRGPPAREIVKSATALEADIVVVGEQGHEGVQGWLGSTAERLLTTCPVPVLVARSLPEGAPARILAAVDESDIAAGVLAWSRLLSERWGAKLHILYVLDGARRDALYITGIAAAREAMEAVAEKVAALGWLKGRLQEAGLDEAQVEVEVISGRAGETILETAERAGAELLVIGSRGARTIGRLVLGSVSRAVLRGAPCPVFVVTDPYAPLDASRA